MVVKGIERKGKNMKYVTPEMEMIKMMAEEIVVTSGIAGDGTSDGTIENGTTVDDILNSLLGDC